MEADGFARPVKRKGWQVTPMTLQSVQDILEAFELTAPSLVVLIIRNATDEQIATFAELVTTAPGDSPASGLNPDLMKAAPIRYLVQICGNPVMTEMALPLATHVERVLRFGLLHDNFLDRAHVRWRSAFLDALAARDEKRAGEEVLKVIHVGAAELYRILQAAESIRSVPLHIERAS